MILIVPFSVTLRSVMLFGSPSMAALAVLGRRANGWTEWKSPDGATLDELKRSNVGVTP